MSNRYSGVDRLRSWGYIVDVTDVHPLTDEEYLETCIKATIKRTALFLELIKRIDWSLSIVVYTCSDRIQHRFLKTRPSFVEKYYEILDKCIAKVLESVNLNNTLVLIVSDHGFKIPKSAFNANRWFISRGYLKLDSPPLRKYIVKTLSYVFSNNMLMLTAARKIASKSRRVSLMLRAKSTSQSSALSELKGAYMPSEDGSVYILNARPPQRKVLVKKIVEELKSRYLNIKLHVSQEHNEKVPDLILESDEWAFATDPYLPLRVGTMRATHSRDGVFIAIGPMDAVSIGFKGRLQIHEVLPIALYFMDMHIPSYIDGDLKLETFKDNFVKNRRPKYMDIPYVKVRIKMKIQRFLLLQRKQQ